jgi:hypothetical protein
MVVRSQTMSQVLEGANAGTRGGSATPMYDVQDCMCLPEECDDDCRQSRRSVLSNAMGVSRLLRARKRSRKTSLSAAPDLEWG